MKSIEIKLITFITTLLLVALTSSALTVIAVNALKSPCPVCSKVCAVQNQETTPSAKTERSYWVPSNNGRRF